MPMRPPEALLHVRELTEDPATPLFLPMPPDAPTDFVRLSLFYCYLLFCLNVIIDVFLVATTICLSVYSSLHKY